MATPRRFLPSLPLLAAFEAAARTGSITQAAQELALTQSAVSRQIRALEGQLGVTLFVREKQTIALTLGGQGYAREVRDALQRISAASMNLRASPAGALTLGVPPGFGARWLIPRLPRFTAQCPDITVNILSRAARFEFRDGIVDATIRFGSPGRGEEPAVMLQPETVLPLCAPELAARHAPRLPQDLRGMPLLHLTTRPDAWERWLREYDVDDSAIHGMLFDQFALLGAAAVAGLGVALLPEQLFQAERAEGRLVEALPLPFRGTEAYYLSWPRDRDDFPPLQHLRRWLIEETAGPTPDAPGPG
ncbi:LysR family transcriptional regulator [Paracoccus gahaiensis]|uniref:LysR family transcriptional regulator n=1 Tax=Paracoccus gahaiensis TaxID=1706839 RepID=A0A4U0RH02_9RHOB|nr:LysR substrate-binding domain-containing protein [Paracoccus gahaiensis]TJZ94072.1 LysR family transcriptional regulator [Paracoccus gahaiensis]